MDERDLECVVALAETTHFGRAALRLNVTQPALSKRLAELERRLGMDLFVRDRRSVRATAAGLAFVAEARLALEHVRAARRDAGRAARGEVGAVRLGYTVVLLYRRLPEVIRTFRETNPGVSLDLLELNSPAHEAALLEGRIDLGLVHPPLERPGLVTRALQAEPLLLAAPGDHPLAAEPGPVSLQALAGEPLLLPPRAIGPHLHDRILAACDEAGFMPRVVQESAPMTTTLGLVAAGMGCAFVARSTTVVRPSGIAYRQILGEPLSLPCALAWLRAPSLRLR